MLCKVCGQKTQPFARAKVLLKYDVRYFQCENCAFVQTEEPYWLEEAYSEAICQADLGPVNRSLSFAELTKTLLLTAFDTNARFLDYGAGYGIFVRRMRDLGFDFYYYDKHCENLFAQGFEIEEPAEQLELLTAFEVFEHFSDPLQEIEKMLRFSSSIFFSTALLPASNPGPSDWWYYAPDYGQHISVFTTKALRVIAQRFNLSLYSNGSSLHLLTARKLSPWLFKAALSQKARPLLNALLNRRKAKASLLPEDVLARTQFTAEQLRCR